MQTHATPFVADVQPIGTDADRRADAAATPPAAAPQPIDAELLKLVGGAGMLYAPVNRWSGR